MSDHWEDVRKLMDLMERTIVREEVGEAKDNGDRMKHILGIQSDRVLQKVIEGIPQALATVNGVNGWTDSVTKSVLDAFLIGLEIGYDAGMEAQP